MSVIEAIRMARENGVRLGVAGADLILDEDWEPAPQVLEAIRRHKAGIVALLTAAKGDWTAEAPCCLFGKPVPDRYGQPDFPIFCDHVPGQRHHSRHRPDPTLV